MIAVAQNTVAPRSITRRVDLTPYYMALRRSSPEMRAVLDQLDVGALARRQAVRVSEGGGVAVPMRSANGAIANIAVLDHELETTLIASETDCSLIDAVGEITADSDVVITTGVSDALVAACMRWSASKLRHTLVLGALDADCYERLAMQAIPRARLAQATLFMTVQATDESVDVARRMLQYAIDKGMKLHRDLIIPIHDPVESLTDAWLAGWRPRR